MLADQAPALPEALDRARQDGLAYVILDGTIIPADRCREPAVSIHGEEIDLWYSGKARTHGGNVQAVFSPAGFPLWVSGAEPGSVYDLTAARACALPALYAAAAAGMPALADPGYTGAGIGIHVPVKQPRTAGSSISAPGPATPCSAPCAASGNAGSPCSPSGGAPCSTSPPAPAKSATSPAPPSS